MDDSHEDDRALFVGSNRSGPSTISSKSRWAVRFVLFLFIVAFVNLSVDVAQKRGVALTQNAYVQGWTRHVQPTPPSGEAYPIRQDFCSVCDCSNRRLPTLLPSYQAPFTGSRKSLAPFMVSSILDISCRHVYAKEPAASLLVHRALATPEQVFAWNLTNLRADTPTAYVFTKTSPSASKTGSLRAGYMQRHVDTFHEHERVLAAREAYFDGVAPHDRQTLWIVVEDASSIDEEILNVLTMSNLNYIYFAFGPTRNYGNAQHNAALTMIHSLTHPLSDGIPFLKHGPVLGIDDDAEIHPDLLQLIWKVQKVGIWPMGNLGPTGWEGPVFDKDGKIVEWAGGNTWRTYPIDNGAFSFNSSLIGSSLLPAPNYWPTDVNGGESEFMEHIVSSRDELEMLCRDCHVAWHNHPLGVPHVDDMTYESGGKPW